MSSADHKGFTPNPGQLQAINFGTGPLRIIAGAGTGKTSTLVSRVVSLIERGLAGPEEILLLTFSKKAAENMAHKINRAVGKAYRQVKAQTYHSFCLEVLTRHGGLLGLPPEPILLNPAELWLIVRNNLDEFDIRYLDCTRIGGSYGIVKKLVDFYREVKHMTGEEIERNFDRNLPEMQEMLRIAELVQEKVRGLGAIDYDDMIFYTLRLFKEYPQVLSEYRENYKFLFVDEYQDTDEAQAELITMLARPGGNITIVGDDDQAIYGFRDARVENIRDFQELFPELFDVVLDINYRSTQCILDAANQLIKNNQTRLTDKQLKAHSGEPGEQPVIWRFENFEEEARYIARTIRQLVTEKLYECGDIAVLVRKRRYLRGIFEAIKALGLPVQVVGGLSLYDCPETRALICFLKVINNPYDSLSLARVLTMPKYGFNQEDLLSLARNRSGDGTLFNNLTWPAVEVDYLKEKINLFLSDLTALGALRLDRNVPELIEEIMNRNIVATTTAGQANIQKLASLAREFHQNKLETSLTAFCEYLEVLIEADEDSKTAEVHTEEAAVKLMTAHSAKGLEFPVVFLARATAAGFGPGKNDDVEEERRLFYVACTRAMERLYLSWASREPGRKNPHGPSPFLQELEGQVIVLEPETAEEGEAVRLARQVAGFCQQCLVQKTGEIPYEELEKLWLDYWQETGEKPPGDGFLQEVYREYLNRIEADEKILQSLTRELETNERITGLKILSYTHLDTYAKCPRRFKWQYLLGVPGRPGNFGAYGSAVHKTIELYGRAVAAGQKPEAGELKEFLRQSYLELSHISAEEVRLGGEERRQKIERDTAAAAPGPIEPTFDPVANFLNSPYARSIPKAVEQEFYYSLGDVVLHGFIDAIFELPDGTYEVVDYKTYREVPPEEEVKKGLQLPIYVMACQEIFDLKISKASLYFLKPDVVVSVNYTQDDLDRFKKEMLSMLIAIADGVFPAKAGNACRYCSYNLACEYAY